MWLCVRTYSSVFGEGIMRDERPTSTQNRMKGRARREGVHLQTAGGFSSRLLSSFVLLHLFSERFSSRVPRRTVRAYVFFFVFFFFASVAPLGTERQPPCHCHHPGGGGAMLCQSSCAGPHTSFLLISPSPQPVL